MGWELNKSVYYIRYILVTKICNNIWVLSKKNQSNASAVFTIFLVIFALKQPIFFIFLIETIKMHLFRHFWKHKNAYLFNYSHSSMLALLWIDGKLVFCFFQIAITFLNGYISSKFFHTFASFNIFLHLKMSYEI